MTLVVVAVASSLIAAAATQDYTDYQESQKIITIKTVNSASRNSFFRLVRLQRSGAVLSVSILHVEVQFVQCYRYFLFVTLYCLMGRVGSHTVDPYTCLEVLVLC